MAQIFQMLHLNFTPNPTELKNFRSGDELIDMGIQFVPRETLTNLVNGKKIAISESVGRLTDDACKHILVEYVKHCKRK